MQNTYDASLHIKICPRACVPVGMRLFVRVFARLCVLSLVHVSRFWLFVFTGTTNCFGSEIERKFKNPPILHDRYNNTNFDYDIALLELDVPVAYSIKVRPICLESEMFIKSDIISQNLPTGKLVGCGSYIRTRGGQSEVLQVGYFPNR